MKLLVDMNLSPTWVSYLGSHQIEAWHWSDIGDPAASDTTVMNWAREREHVVFTHDLDFSALLAATEAKGPIDISVNHDNR